MNHTMTTATTELRDWASTYAGIVNDDHRGFFEERDLAEKATELSSRITGHQRTRHPLRDWSLTREDGEVFTFRLEHEYVGIISGHSWTIYDQDGTPYKSSGSYIRDTDGIAALVALIVAWADGE